MNRFQGRIVAAWAEPASGPGWNNSPLWVLIQEESTLKLRLECFQPNEQTEEMRILYNSSAVVTEAMTGAARRAVAALKGNHVL